MKNIIQGVAIGITLAMLLMWTLTVETRAWTRSGSTALLKETGSVTLVMGDKWYISESPKLSPVMWDALAKLKINYVMIENHIIELTWYDN